MLMKGGAARSFGAQLKALRETAGFTQEELATIAGLSVHAVSALERGERRRPQVETVRALSAALDLTGAARDAFVAIARGPAQDAAVDELSDVSLPVALTSLVGRDADLRTLRHWLADTGARLVTLTGPGGAGKTRLALEVGQAIAAEGAARVVFVPLAAIGTAALVAPAIAQALGLSDVAAIDLPRRSRIACGDQPTLLLLDNFEQVLDAAPLVADLLASVASLRTLVTSRAPLRIRGEREYVVGPLTLEIGADATSPADLARAPAVRLFVERVRDVQPDFRLTPANGPTVTAICRRLDALPLALELAAPWLKVLTAEDLLRRLSHDVLIPAVGPRDLPERQQTITATVAWSYQLLSTDEQRLFRRLSALSGRFSIGAAEAVFAGRDGSSNSDETLIAVAGLVDRSLVLRAETEGAARPLYQMLETVRAYAAIALTEAGEREDAIEGLVRYCSHEASLASEALVGPAQAEWLGRVRDDIENYRAALTWLLERGGSAAADILWGLMAFWLMRGHLTEGLEWYERTLNLSSLPPTAEARSLVGAALMWYTQGHLQRATTALTRALAIAQGSGDGDVAVVADNLLGHIDHAVGNLTSARERHLRSLEIFRARGVPWGIGNALGGLAAVALATGDVQEADGLLIEATSVLRRAGPWFLTPVMYLRSILAVGRGNADEAIALLRESLAHIRELQDKFSFVYAMVALAAAAALKGDDARAARVLGAGDAVTERTGATVVDKSVQNIREQAERAVRARLGLARWAHAYTAGRSASIDALTQDVDGIL
jgi:predicted ATPase/DNA-binding XRE family transcriptional regulator